MISKRNQARAEYNRLQYQSGMHGTEPDYSDAAFERWLYCKNTFITRYITIKVTTPIDVSDDQLKGWFDDAIAESAGSDDEESQDQIEGWDIGSITVSPGEGSTL